MEQKLLNDELECIFDAGKYDTITNYELENKVNYKVSNIIVEELVDPINKLLCDNFGYLIDDQIEDYTKYAGELYDILREELRKTFHKTIGNELYCEFFELYDELNHELAHEFSHKINELIKNGNI